VTEVVTVVQVDSLGLVLRPQIGLEALESHLSFAAFVVTDPAPSLILHPSWLTARQDLVHVPKQAHPSDIARFLLRGVITLPIRKMASLCDAVEDDLLQVPADHHPNVLASAPDLEYLYTHAVRGYLVLSSVRVVSSSDSSQPLVLWGLIAVDQLDPGSLVSLE
jgi:hypothetical protein